MRKHQDVASVSAASNGQQADPESQAAADEPVMAGRLEQVRSSRLDANENNPKVVKPDASSARAENQLSSSRNELRANATKLRPAPEPPTSKKQNVDRNAEYLRKRWLEKENLSSGMEEQARKRRQYDDATNVTSTTNSKQLADAQRATSFKDQSMVKCDYCFYIMPANAIHRHVLRKHANVNGTTGLLDKANGAIAETASEMIKCKYCAHDMPYSVMSRHVQRKHANQTDTNANKVGTFHQSEKPEKPPVSSGQHVVYYSSSLIQRKLKENLIYEKDGRFYANEAKWYDGGELNRRKLDFLRVDVGRRIFYP